MVVGRALFWVVVLVFAAMRIFGADLFVLGVEKRPNDFGTPVWAEFTIQKAAFPPLQ